jgi:phage major head subunit gpT-like protein
MPTPITPASLRAAAVQVLTKLDTARSKVSSNWSSVARKIQSTGRSTLHSNMLDIDKIERKGTGYKFGKLSSQAYEVTNDDWGLGIEIGVNDIADDVLHLYDERLELLAKRIEQFPDDLIFNLMKTGITEICIDGETFFSDTHKADPNNVITGVNTYDNKLALALDVTNFNDAYQKMLMFPDGKGRPMGLMPTHLIVPPQLRKTAKDILEADTVSTGGTNVNKGEVQLVVEPLLGDEGTRWFLISMDAGAPFFIQEREALTTIVKNLPTDDNVFYDDVIKILTKGRGEGGYGIPQRAIYSKP